MKYNGVDLREVHPLVSLDHCGVSGWRREIRRIEAAKRDLILQGRDINAEFFAVVNLSGRTPEEGEAALAAVRAWAFAGGGVHEIDDGKSPGRVLDGILQDIDEPEMVHGFGTVRIAWLLEEPHKRSAQESQASGEGGTELAFMCDGTADTYAVFEVAPLEAGQELVLMLDGEPLLRIEGKLAVGQMLRMDTAREALTIDGADARAKTDWTATDYDRPLSPGAHTLNCSVPAVLRVRWHARWV